MEVVTILIGFLIGTLVGISGIGGAVMLLPLLIIVLKIPPLVAVGSDLVFAALTKIGAGAVHVGQKTVDLTIVLYLSIGSIPGAVIGFRGLAVMRAATGDAFDDIMRTLIGVLLVVIPVFLLAQILILRSREKETSSNGGDEPVKRIQTIIIGLVGGALVGLTSVGSGSVILVALLLVYRRPPAQLVGTDIVHAIILTGLTGALHFTYLDTVDMNLVLLLLVGSIPGALIGATLSVRLQARNLQVVLLVMLFATGVYMISS